MKIQLPDMTCQLITSHCYPKKDYFTREVIVDKDGNKFYLVKVQVRDDDGKGIEEQVITVKAKDNPVADMNALDMVTFSGVQISFGSFVDKGFRGTPNAENSSEESSEEFKRQTKKQVKKYCKLSAERVKRA